MTDACVVYTADEMMPWMQCINGNILSLSLKKLQSINALLWTGKSPLRHKSNGDYC